MGFWDIVGKVASSVMEQASKSQNEQMRRNNTKLRDYERKLNNAQKSEKMTNPEYARRINEAQEKFNKAKQQLYGDADVNLSKTYSPRNVEVGAAALKDIANSQKYNNKPGVYILILNGTIMKVGSAVIGVQKRMQQYYGLNQHCGLNQYINEVNRDNIKVKFQHCPADKCPELESKLFDKYGGVESMPWASRRPHNNSNTYSLKI